MIDIEAEIFDGMKKQLVASFPEITVKSTTTRAPKEFPCVCIEEFDNYSLLTTRDSSSNNCHSVVAYEVYVYSNKQNGRKNECKKIFSSVDEYFDRIGFTRTSRQPITVDNTETIYCLVGRYTAVVSQNKTIYRR